MGLEVFPVRVMAAPKTSPSFKWMRFTRLKFSSQKCNSAVPDKTMPDMRWTCPWL